ncbi:MAG: CDGSH iron-sulfur domain-containing protein [Solirubrobacterales bacterium]|nr:CDGSH iron-sulfur domain-containing protein [Solirubrobacterales bacterium]
MSTIQGAATAGRDILERADALGRAFEALASASTDAPRRSSLARAADRLNASVVTPLSIVLGAVEQAQAGEAPGSQTELETAVHELACDATHLRVRVGGPPALLEATAALQDLSCQLIADDDERLSARRSELESLMSTAKPGVQVAEDGPYLVTNVPLISDHLGVSLDPLPQVALCRCGASQLKPWCDGSHHALGFSGSKDPDRVPDRLDSYEGQHLIVTDNRGTCAHSGFCTDRAPTAFRSDAEPFVAPAGARADEIIRAARDCPSGALGYKLHEQDPDDAADQTREPAIEVSLDGPYRITGAIGLIDDEGNTPARNAGASLEHFSLCRCGKSQNKPFCSGMHWYADFHDPQPADKPTLFEWAGGFPALLRLTRRFYETHVPTEPLLGDLFGRMSPDHPERVASWLGQVFGGTPAYSDRYGGYERMISQHLDKGITLEQRALWVALLGRSADDVGLPADAEFRAAFIAYLEWGSRIAVENSKPGVHPPPKMPVPRWWWVCDAEPWARAHATADVEAEVEIALPGPEEELSFATHVKPLFRKRDRDSMRFAFDLWSAEEVTANGPAILERLKAGSMPCDGPWPPERVAVFERWIADCNPA